MGLLLSKEFRAKRKVDEATSNTSLSNVRYVVTEKPKWKVFKKKEVVPIPQYLPPKGCACGNEGICKKKITPAGVTIHYPQKKRKFTAFGGKRRYKPPKIKRSKFSNHRPINKLKGRPKKFTTWRLDNIAYNTPFNKTYTPPRPDVFSESDISVTLRSDVTSSSDVTVRSDVVN
ncbi:uncharacterized protein LOC111358102 isoform X2 [Spodoptera litura]|uniref:Uncharacterized protein LOC111358102 isoform X2 n=1 Tax=Spodoptera litura TaxID=69820 RepID=A0A9J7EDF6_SPOLT|nr:uncharacterized protein LOC111358102 isoform X2 [Spodoptera litura]